MHKISCLNEHELSCFLAYNLAKYLVRDIRGLGGKRVQKRYGHGNHEHVAIVLKALWASDYHSI